MCVDVAQSVEKGFGYDVALIARQRKRKRHNVMEFVQQIVAAIAKRCKHKRIEVTETLAAFVARAVSHKTCRFASTSS